MNDCINRPDTRLHPTHASEAQFATCNAGAIHTGRFGSDTKQTMQLCTSYRFTSIIDRMRAAMVSIGNGLVSTDMPGVRCPLPTSAFSA